MTGRYCVCLEFGSYLSFVLRDGGMEGALGLDPQQEQLGESPLQCFTFSPHVCTHTGAPWGSPEFCRSRLSSRGPGSSSSGESSSCLVPWAQTQTTAGLKSKHCLAVTTKKNVASIQPIFGDSCGFRGVHWVSNFCL